MSSDTRKLVEVEDLRLELPAGDQMIPILRCVNFSVGSGEAVGLVGESGSGKSLTARSIARLLPPGANVGGTVRFDGAAVSDLKGDDLRAWRRHSLQLIFQDPRAHLNPVRKIGDFLREPLVVNEGMSVQKANKKAVALLERLRVTQATLRLDQYPHQLSGGLLQRVMIAGALTASPRMLIADEPTTALDVTTQAEVMKILDELRRDQDMALLFITHDLELAAAICDRTVVMYAGTVLEDHASGPLHQNPLHPYTSALLAARPDVTRRKARLATIPGRPLAASEAPDGCPFSARCAFSRPECDVTRPQLYGLKGGLTACIRAEELLRQRDGASA